MPKAEKLAQGRVGDFKCEEMIQALQWQTAAAVSVHEQRSSMQLKPMLQVLLQLCPESSPAVQTEDARPGTCLHSSPMFPWIEASIEVS